MSGPLEDEKVLQLVYRRAVDLIRGLLVGGNLGKPEQLPRMSAEKGTEEV